MDRTWDELNRNDLTNGFNAEIIDQKFNNLYWKTIYFNDIDKEKEMIFNTLDYLNNLNSNINYILITDYQIYNSITNRKDYSPVKYWFKDATYPNQQHSLRENFEKFFKSKILENNVTQIIIDNTAKFKSDEINEFFWLKKCLLKNRLTKIKPNVDIFFIKENCIK